MLQQVRSRGTALVCLLLFACIWSASAGYLVLHGRSALRPVVALVVFGMALPGLALLFTRGARPSLIPVDHPTRELTAVLGYLVLYAFYFLGWATGAVHAATNPGPERDIAILILNLGVGVSAPAVLLYLLGAHVGPLFGMGIGRKGFWPILLVVGPLLALTVALAGANVKIAQGLALPPETLLWAVPSAFVFLVLSMGLAEEFLFRAVLQSRLSAVLESEVCAIVISALMYAMARVPGTYFRGGPGMPGWSTDLWHIVAYAICVNGPLGILVGVVWARTRSLLLISLLHGFALTVIGVADFAAGWG